MNDDKDPKDGGETGGNPWIRSMAIWAGIIFAMLLVASMFGGGGKAANSVAYSDFIGQVRQGEIASVVVGPESIVAKKSDGSEISTIAPKDAQPTQFLIDNNVQVSSAGSGSTSIWLYLLIQALPFILILGVAFFVIRHMQKTGGTSGAMGFGKSKAKLLTERHGRVTFEDVAGVDEAQAKTCEEIVEFLKDPHKFSAPRRQDSERRACSSVSPGTGKTLLARAIAGEAECAVLHHLGLRLRRDVRRRRRVRVRDMFEQAKKNAPCIIFIDEIDAVGRHRGAGLGNGNDEREQTLNQLLVEMDGFEANEGIIIIAATNRPDVLDPALLRPGRFDRQVVVPRPDIEGREKILAYI